ncbi:MAG: 5-amino-6-(5-phospho-D-ribitylamino)uracil phosphatase YitU [Candidatus Tyloplasma litorale]|nr:MAG: 5-amino-6-(5-phospho-D-ribitylamino)uracil phosphatase YitU [Mycoplasmatales bacterium]
MNTKKDKWIIGVDLDGTVLMSWDGKIDENGSRIDRIHPLTERVIKELTNQGHVIVIDTGRNWYESKRIYKQLGLNSYIINSAGAHIHNPSDKNAKQFIIGVPNKLIKEIINDEIWRDHIEQVFVDDLNQTYMQIFKRTKFVDLSSRFWDVKEHDGNFDFDSQCIVATLNLNREQIQPILNYLRDKYGETINFANWTGTDEHIGIEFNPSNSNKGTALLQVADELGIPRDNTMGIGDAENDLDLLKLVKHGVVMKNGLDYVRQHAQYETKKDNDEGGVGDFLQSFFLEGEEE